MKNVKIILFLFVLFIAMPLCAQEEGPVPTIPDKVSAGLGIGLDHGGIGANLLFYPQKNIGLFVGGGYALAGFGVNGGVKIRFIPKKINYRVDAFGTAMYGYNAAVMVVDGSQFNKVFYGPSVGAGIDLRPRPHKKGGYLSFAIIVPFRGSEVNDYLDHLESEHNVQMDSDLLPITISVGYKFILN